MRTVVIIVLNALGLALTYPIIAQNKSCLILTPKKQNQIDEIAQKIGEYITHLTNEYDDIDITSVKLTFEKYSEDESKETVISVDINECSDGDSKSSDDINESKVIKDFRDGKNLDKGGIEAIGGKFGEVSFAVIDPRKAVVHEVTAPSCSCQNKPPVKAELMMLQVNDEQEQLLQALERSRPGPLVLVQRKTANGEEYLFF